MYHIFTTFVRNIKYFIIFICKSQYKIGKKIPNGIKQYKSRDAALEDFNNKKMYYKHIIKNDIVKESYVEFIIDNNKISLKGADPDYYEHNKNVLLRTFDSNNCTMRDTNIHCSAYGMYANAFQNGYVEVGYSYWNCYVSEKETHYALLEIKIQ